MPLNTTLFREQLALAKTGEKVIYHTGSLAYDRVRGQRFAEVHALGCAAYEAYERGECTLTTKKLGPNTSDYYAVKQ